MSLSHLLIIKSDLVLIVIPDTLHGQKSSVTDQGKRQCLIHILINPIVDHQIWNRRSSLDPVDKFLHICPADLFLSIYDGYKLVSSISAHRPVTNLISVRISQIGKNLITGLLPVSSVDPFKILYICHHHMKILVPIKAHQCLCMMEKGLSDIKPCKIIIFQCRKDHK